MEFDFFTYTKQLIANDNESGRGDVAHSRVATLSSLAKFLGKEELLFNELSLEFMVRFEDWLIANGLKESTIRFYLNQVNAIYN